MRSFHHFADADNMMKMMAHFLAQFWLTFWLSFELPRACNIVFIYKDVSLYII